jgi:hypothetical protein
MSVAAASSCKLYDGTILPIIGSDGVEVNEARALGVYYSLLELEKESSGSSGNGLLEEGFEALHILYRACLFLKTEKLNVCERYPLEPGPGLDLLKRHKFVKGKEVTAKLLLVSNCLWQMSEEYNPQKRVWILHPFRENKKKSLN